MTNNIVGFEKYGVKVIKDANTKIIHLVQTGTGTLTLHDVGANNVDYQVPTGKKATIIAFDTFYANTVGNAVGYADNVNGTTNNVPLLYVWNTSVHSNFAFISAEVPAGKYINQMVLTSGTFNNGTDCWVVEEDA